MRRYILRIAESLNMSFETLVILIVAVGGLIFYGKDFKLGVVLHFFLFSALFVWFYTSHLNYTSSLVAMLLSFAIMALTLYFTSSGRVGGDINA